MSGVSVDFFCGVVKLLVKRHGDRCCDLEYIRRRLEEIETNYKGGSLFVPPKKWKAK